MSKRKLTAMERWLLTSAKNAAEHGEWLDPLAGNTTQVLRRLEASGLVESTCGEVERLRRGERVLVARDVYRPTAAGLESLKAGEVEVSPPATGNGEGG